MEGRKGAGGGRVGLSVWPAASLGSAQRLRGEAGDRSISRNSSRVSGGRETSPQFLMSHSCHSTPLAGATRDPRNAGAPGFKRPLSVTWGWGTGVHTATQIPCCCPREQAPLIRNLTPVQDSVALPAEPGHRPKCQSQTPLSLC